MVPVGRSEVRSGSRDGMGCWQLHAAVLCLSLAGSDVSVYAGKELVLEHDKILKQSVIRTCVPGGPALLRHEPPLPLLRVPQGNARRWRQISAAPAGLGSGCCSSAEVSRGKGSTVENNLCSFGIFLFLQPSWKWSIPVSISGT